MASTPSPQQGQRQKAQTSPEALASAEELPLLQAQLQQALP
jgi:hypothetical protein